jgi:hypothetical protein
MPITLQYGDASQATRTAVSTTVGGNAEISTSEFVFGNASLRTFANASQVTMTNAGGILSIGTNNFTIELRVRPVTKATSFPHIIANFVSGFSSNQWVLCDRHNAYPNNFSFWVGNANAGAPILVSTTTVANDTWYAISITRSGNTWRMFINGTLEATTTTSASLDGNSSSDWYFSPNNSSIWYNGYVDEVRVSNIARYTATYTPATSAFTNDANTTMLLHCDGTNGSKSLPDDNMSIVPTGGITFNYAGGTGITLQYEIGVVATGGTITDITVGNVNYRVHTFTSTGNFVVTNGGPVEYFIVGGGGGGGRGGGGNHGGGGAGGLLTASTTVTPQTYTVTVGAGGTFNAQGANSVFAGQTAVGGGFGGTGGGTFNGGAGGSGGGGGSTSPSPQGLGGAGTAGQGNAGGNGAQSPSFSCGGGGGAGAVGGNGVASGVGAGAGSGGIGIQSSFNGTATYYAGGGGGAAGNFGGAVVGVGGLGGGGAGAYAANTYPGTSGTTNTGGGGGGGTFNQSASSGLPGGSGIVMIRYVL